MKPLYTLLIVLMPFIGLSKSESNTISEPISASVVVDEINSLDCIDPSLINPDAICFFIYDPVCGCNNVTYSNSCFAENSGVLSWVNGECSSAIVFGCTDETATNFNASATTDDGSCTYLEPEGFNVTFSINTANIIVGPNGMYIGGGMFGDAMALPLSDDDGDGIWTGVTYINNGASGNYTLLNSPNNGGDWGAKENIAGLPCADAANWNDRILPAISSDTTLLHCFETCGSDGTCPLISGCTDESAMNYNPAASEDDGSCEFLVDGESPYCDTQIYHFAIEAEVVSSVFLSIGNNGPNSIIIQVESADADPVDDLIIYSSTAGNTLGELSSNNGIYSNTMTWNSDVNTVDINVLWSKQSFGGNWQLSQNNLTINVNDTCDISITPSISGCTDATALNYNPDANLDDGSCEFCIDSDLIDSNAFCIEIYEPVCGCNNVTFNNSCYAEISGVVNWIAGECSSSNVFGCTDETASNYNPDAIMDDGSCVACQELTTINFSVDASYLISAEYDNVLVNGSWDAFGDSNQYWGAWGVTLTDDNMDGIYTGSLSLEPGFYEYVHALSGPADGNSGWGIIGYAPDDCALGTNPISGDDAPNYYFDAQCGQVIDLPIICFGECNDCSVIITTGCMDPSADNYNPGATEDDGSCTYCEEFQVSILSTQDVYFEGSSDGYVIATGVNGTNDYNIIVFDLNGTQQNPFALSAGVYIVSVTDMISGCTSEAQFSINELFTNIPGCTDSLANNFNPEANIDNGDCDYCLNFLNSFNDIVDYSCDDSQEFDTIDAIIENNPNTGSPHINLPNEICYTITPPSSGPHRSSWAKWGEYEYLPPQRWLHNLEHGGIAFLYHPCAEQSVIDSLRNIACSMPDDETGAFRWVLTPYPNLPSKISIVAWEWSYSKNSVDSDEIFTFILEHYRQAPEDFPYDGSYNDLYIGKCSELIGCTDQDAENYNPIAVVDDGSCIEEHYHACENEIEGLFVNNIIHNRVVFNWDSPEENPSHYMIRYRPVGTSSWTVMSAGPVNSNEFNGTSRTRYFMQPGTTYEWNIRARVLNEDGSTNCQSPWSASSQYTTLDACANLENLSATTEANWATLSADAPDASWGVWQSKGKIRVVGTNSFRYVNGSSDGSISVLKGNFEPSTDYEWHTKAWCTGNIDDNGDSDPQYHSGWGDFSTFSTQALCDKMPTNLSTGSNGAQTAITMSWSTPESGQPDHYFLELTNVTTGQVWAWNNIAGSSTSKTKFGLTAGDYSWRIRGACGTNGTSWATIFSQPVEYTLGGARLETSSLANLDVYPNPSSGIFYLNFYANAKTEIIVSSLVGEKVYKQTFSANNDVYLTIDLSNYANGLYKLSLITKHGINNYKLIKQ